MKSLANIILYNQFSTINPVFVKLSTKSCCIGCLILDKIMYYIKLFTGVDNIDTFYAYCLYGQNLIVLAAAGWIYKPQVLKLRTYLVLYCFMGAIIGVEIHLFNLAHQRIAGVGTGALVVEGLLDHIIKTGQEIFFINAIVFDGFLDANTFF